MVRAIPAIRQTTSEAETGEGKDAASAWFELLLYELFTQLDCRVDVKDIDNTGKNPDFLVSQDTRGCYVEATTVNPEDNPSRADPNLEDALCKLRTLTSSVFRMRLVVVGRIPRTLGKKELIETFGSLLKNDPVMVQEQIQARGQVAAPYTEIEGKGWSLRGELVPISPGSKPRELIIGPMGGYAGDASPQVQKAVSKKAGKYDALDAPLVVTANVLDVRFDGDAAVAALFGPEQIRYFPVILKSQTSSSGNLMGYGSKGATNRDTDGCLE